MNNYYYCKDNFNEDQKKYHIILRKSKNDKKN